MSTRRQSRRITVESPVDVDTATIDHQLNKEVTQHHFPYKLYDMLEYAADSEYSSSVSWSDDGTSFAINNKDIFMECIVPLFFKQTKFRSFVSRLDVVHILCLFYCNILRRCVVYLSSYYINYYSLLSTAQTYNTYNRQDSSIYGVSQETLIVVHGSTKILSAAELKDFNTSRELRIRARHLLVLQTPSN